MSIEFLQLEREIAKKKAELQVNLEELNCSTNRISTYGIMRSIDELILLRIQMQECIKANNGS